VKKQWCLSWTAIPVDRDAVSRVTPIPESFAGQTLRQVVRISAGGVRLRVRLSNEHGVEPLQIGAATLAIAQEQAAIVAGSARALQFDGSSAIEVAAGETVISDPVDLPVGDFTALAVSLYLPHSSRADTLHVYDESPTFISPPGNFTTAARMPVEASSTTLFFLKAIEVETPSAVRAVVALGDSITSGIEEAWPIPLARRLRAREGKSIAVVNAGIPGNRLLDDGLGPSILNRFERDALSVPGVTHVALLAGINDLGYVDFTADLGPTVPRRSSMRAAQLIEAYQQLIGRAHAAGVKLIGGTLTPFAGASGVVNKNYYSADKEVERRAVNAWIRECGLFDGVIDFAAAVAEPDDPGRMRHDLHIGDFLHPNAAGNRAIAESVDLTLFDSNLSTHI
jgi:lysophospholipase L1-like esterase